MDSLPVYLIFGAAGGIGSKLVEQLASNNNQVIAIGRKAIESTPFINKPNIEYQQLVEISCASIEACFNEVIRKYERVDGAVNCIGSILLKPAHLTTEQEWHDTLFTNLESAFAVVRAAGKTMLTGGSVVLMSSAASKVGLPNHEAIAAAKSGINGLVISAAATYASRNLRFNAVAPGLVDTPLTQRITANPAALAASIANHALGRIGQPEEIARLITWLLAPENSWITGQIISLDGGLAHLRGRTNVPAH